VELVIVRINILVKLVTASLEIEPKKKQRKSVKRKYMLNAG